MARTAQSGGIDVGALGIVPEFHAADFPGKLDAMLHTLEMRAGYCAPPPRARRRSHGHGRRRQGVSQVMPAGNLQISVRGTRAPRNFRNHRRSRRPAQTRRRAPGPGWKTTPPWHFTSVSHGPGFGVVVIQNHAVVAGAILERPAFSWRYTPPWCHDDSDDPPKCSEPPPPLGWNCSAVSIWKEEHLADGHVLRRACPALRPE